tara:strand:- start:7023 stop:7511 length:489 start_codon:yes stop_codon:yes gene_type:complete
MKKTAFAALSALTLSMLAGCAGVDTAESVDGRATALVPAVETAVGTYTLDKSALKQVWEAAMPAEGPSAEQAAQMVAQMMDGFDGSMELKGDQTCTVSMTMMGQKQDVTGVWKLDGDQLSITAQEEGKDDDTRIATLVDGVITISDEQGERSMSLRFVRSVE